MNLARSLKAEDVVEIEVNSRTVNVIKALGSGKALIVLVDIRVFEISVRIDDCWDVVTTQGFDETILMSAIRSFDASLGLWWMSVDQLNAEGFESTRPSVWQWCLL
jgi:hypothetical protein